MKESLTRFTFIALVVSFAVCGAAGQGFKREFKLGPGATISVINLSGRVEVTTSQGAGDAQPVLLSATAPDGISESDIKAEASGDSLQIQAGNATNNKRIDITLVVPERVKLKIETREGEVRVIGDLESVEVKTETGTIAADVPTDDLRYDFSWTASRPRYLSDIELGKVKERSAGKFQLKGRFGEGAKKVKKESEENEEDPNPEPIRPTSKDEVKTDGDGDENKEAPKEKSEKITPRSKAISLSFTTARGIVLLNVPPNEVMSDLRERPLTNAARAIIRSGDVVLTDAIRRATPKYFGDYARTLPPMRSEPKLSVTARESDIAGETTKEAVVRVTDVNNRAIGDLKMSDFTVAESGSVRDILSVSTHEAPVNLVLLLDVSGSVDNYVNFIRKAARAFIDTAHNDDRISVILFNEDVKVLSGFSTNKAKLSESLDTFDAGGATAYYDAIAFSLADTLRPLKGERTAIVVLTDGDDNRSFLPFDSLISAIEESGALIYPLYVPSALIAATEANPDKTLDPLRTRYMTLSARATGEGERIAKISGGVYYPITQLSQIQTAYDDIVRQVRTAYVVKFRSGYQADPQNRPSPRLKIRVNKPNAFAQVNSVSLAKK